MNCLQRWTAVVVGLFISQGTARAQTPSTTPTGPPPVAGRMGMPCCAMHMGMQQRPPTGLQAMQQAFNLLYGLDKQLQKGGIKTSSARAVRDDVRAMQQAAQAKNATLAERKEKTLQALTSSIADLRNLQGDAQVPAASRTALSAVIQQLEQLYELAQQ